MARSSKPSQTELNTDTEARLTFAGWVASRATALVAVGVLVGLLAILIVISLLHPR